MGGRKAIWGAGALVWLIVGVGLGLLVGAHRPAPLPPYAIEKSEEGGPICVVTRDAARLCFAPTYSVDAAIDAAQKEWAEDKEIMRAFWGVFTLAPPGFIILVLWLIWRSGGVPEGFKRLEEEGVKAGQGRVVDPPA
ncbi:hypothetical protein MTBLM1_20145 [Rhodospirillaceae bacterium LM-1]|nr:hypothetical protein MTBLM1_20145 [Rhodospirillaceae bacterium LM-1]